MVRLYRRHCYGFGFGSAVWARALTRIWATFPSLHESEVIGLLGRTPSPDFGDHAILWLAHRVLGG